MLTLLIIIKIKVSNNPITTSGALAIIYSIKLNNSSMIEELDLTVIFFFK
jgi:hypothetical protein